ncbi:peptidyl-prolyl cis-trans isomerase [Eupransor demetentiae]|uniref:Foldase protein PrsA n=1 Tax=Eupransor demetentiae TaxID=3109584 RepID=A0ABP0ENC3_9LACO|nr:Peptidyl-prolyl isomerase [Lactobacillaceae bacterium LMG 33000]
MRRKLVWGLLAVVFIGGLVYLYFNSSKTVMSSSAGKITQKEYYDDVKASQAGQQEFAQMSVRKVLEHYYGKDVTKKQTDQAYETQRAQFGSDANYKAYLASNGYTDQQVKNNIRLNMLQTAAIKDNHKISQSDLDKAYKSYVPDTTISLITTSSEDKAQAAIDALSNGSSWASVYKKYSTKNNAASATGQLPTFDSTSSTPEEAVRKAAFNMNVGNTSDSPVKGANGAYYVIKLDKMAKKPSEKQIETKLKDKLTNDFIGNSKNQSSINKIIGKILRKADVNVKDSDLKNALSGYMTAGVSK